MSRPTVNSRRCARWGVGADGGGMPVCVENPSISRAISIEQQLAVQPTGRIALCSSPLLFLCVIRLIDRVIHISVGSLHTLGVGLSASSKAITITSRLKLRKFSRLKLRLVSPLVFFNIAQVLPAASGKKERHDQNNTHLATAQSPKD